MESPVNPSLYAWSADSQNPNLYVRRALGLENKWVRKAQADPRQVLRYLSGQLTLQTAISIGDFMALARYAWMELRWHYPEICLGPYLPSHTGKPATEMPQMCCLLPSSEEEAVVWADETLMFDFDVNEGDETMSGAVARLRSQVVESTGERMPSVSLILAARREENPPAGSMVKKVQYAFRVDHACTDGTGAYLIAGGFFAMLAKHIDPAGVQREPELDWRCCIDNLQEPWIGQLNQEQRMSGGQFENTVDTVHQKLHKSGEYDWGLPFKDSNGRYEPAWKYLAFSKEKTHRILVACKERLGISTTVLWYAASIVATFKASKQSCLPREDLTCPLFLNGRRYLQHKASKSKIHLPMCRAMGFIEFTGVQKLFLADRPTAEETHEALLYACHQVKKSYQDIRYQPSLLTESFVALEHVVVAQKNIHSSNAEPFLSNDGFTEQFIGQVYLDASRTRKIISVDEVQFVADPDGPPIVIRISSFRGTLRLSVEWNSACYEKQKAHDFLMEVYLLMISIT